MQRLQPNFITDGIRNFMAQQKQRKQLILTDDKNIFTYCFQPIQRLQPNFKTDGIRNFIHTKHNGDNARFRVFSSIPQRQLYTTQFCESYIPNNQTYKPNPNNQNINVVFATNTKFMLLQLRKRKF